MNKEFCLFQVDKKKEQYGKLLVFAIINGNIVVL